MPLDTPFEVDREACDRARQWATADLDGELSRFERVLLSAHLVDCPSCREFSTAIGGFTEMLRTAPLEQLERPIEIGRLRRRVGLRLAPAVAAMAVTVVGLGSILDPFLRHLDTFILT